MEKALKKLVVGLAVLGMVLFLANLLVDNPYTHRLIRAVLNRQVKAATNLTVDFKAIKVGVVPPGLDLYGVYVAPNVAPDAPLLTASHVRARVSVWSLVLGTVRLARVEVDDLAVVWPPPWNFEAFLRATPLVGPPEDARPRWPPKFDLPIDRLSLKNAKAFVETPLFALPERASYLGFSVVGVDVDVTYAGWRDVKLDLSVKTLDLALGARSMLEETGVEVHAALSGNKITVAQLALDGERLKAKGKATVELRTVDPGALLTAVHLAANADVHGDLSMLGSFLDLPDTRGGVDGDVQVAVNIPTFGHAKPTFSVKGKGKVQDARLYGFRLHNSQTAFAVDPESVHLTDTLVILGDKQVGKGSGVIKINDAVDVDFHIEPQGLHLLDLLDALGVQTDAVDVVLDSPDLHLAGHGEPLLLRVSATAQATDVTLPPHPYDHSAYPVSPACLLDFHLQVTQAALDFGQTHGTCFQPATSAPLPMPPAGSIKPPASALAASPVDVSGRIKTGQSPVAVDLHVRSPAVQLLLGQYFAQIPLGGVAEAETDITGTPAVLKIDVRARAEAATVAKVPLGSFSATVAVAVDKMIVSWRDVVVRPGGAARIEAPAGQLDLNGAGLEEYRIKTKLTARSLDHATVAGMLRGTGSEPRFAAAVPSLDAELDAPLTRPLAGTGEARFVLAEATLDGEPLFQTFSGLLKSTPAGWQASDLDAKLGHLEVTGAFTHRRAAAPLSARQEAGLWQMLGISSRDRITADVAVAAPPSGTDDQLGDLPVVGRTLRTAGIKGLLEARGSLEGSLGALQGTINGSVTQPSIFGSVMAPVNFKGFVKGPHLEFLVDHAGSSLQGRMAVDVQKDGIPYEWFFHLDRMDLRALGTPLFHADPRNYLYLSADWRMQGKLQDWWRSTGELDIQDLRGNYVRDIAAQTKSLQLRQEQPVKLLFTEKGWRFEGDKDLYLSGRSVQLRVSTVDSRPPMRLGLRLDSVIDMQIAKEFSQEVETADGKVHVVAEVMGSTADPHPTVEITDLKQNPFIAATWKPVSLGLADVRPAFKNVHVRVLYEGGRLTIDKFSADKGTSGTVTANGSLNLAEGGDETRLDITLQDATIVYPVAFLKSFETEVSGNVVVSGQGVPYKIAGDIVVNKARSTREVDIRDEIINALRQKSFSANLVADNPTAVFDLNIAADQTINIRNHNLQSVLSADLHIRGTDLAPQVSGQVEINKGRFVYKSDFRVTRGLVTFDDPVKPDPSLDIEAVSEVDIYRVNISISGRASNPTVEFSVDPPTRPSGTPIEKLEILVLLSTGKLPDEAHTVGQDAQSAATSEAATLVLGQFQDPVEKLLDASGQNVVRNVYLDTHPSLIDGSPVPRLNLPLDLGEDVDLVFRTDQTANEVTLEYNVNENINVNLTGTKDLKHPDVQQAAGTTAGLTPANSGATSSLDADARVNLKFRFPFE